MPLLCAATLHVKENPDVSILSGYDEVLPLFNSSAQNLKLRPFRRLVQSLPFFTPSRIYVTEILFAQNQHTKHGTLFAHA
jgi:hypothetical protein